MKQLTGLSLNVRIWLRRIYGDEYGATATEYGILAGFIALVIVAGVGAFGLALNGVFTGLGNDLKSALGIP